MLNSGVFASSVAATELRLSDTLHAMEEKKLPTRCDMPRATSSWLSSTGLPIYP